MTERSPQFREEYRKETAESIRRNSTLDERQIIYSNSFMLNSLKERKLNEGIRRKFG